MFAPRPKPYLPHRAPRAGLGYLASLADALPSLDGDKLEEKKPQDIKPDRSPPSPERPTRGLPRQSPATGGFSRLRAGHSSQPLPPHAAQPKSHPPSPQVAALREREAAEAVRGEEAWVLAGGVLRDAQGKRDSARTAAVRQAALKRLRQEERERVKKQRWAAYEAQWGAVARMPVGTVRFADMPWPVHAVETEDEDDGEGDMKHGESRPTMPGLFGTQGTPAGWGGHAVRSEDVTEAAVEQFMRSAAEYAAPTSTDKVASDHALRDRVRRGLLRWHPDKLVSVLKRVDPEDSEAVERAARIVFSALQGMNAKMGA